jgi:hypothetical protein
MKKLILTTFIAGLVLCQGNMALAAEPELSSQAIETTSETVAKSGVINGNIYWAVNNNVLTISSKSTKGVIPDFTEDSPAPWKEFAFSISELHIESDIAEIGDYAFYNLFNLKTVVNNSSSLTRIGSYAFSLTGISAIDLPDTLTELGAYAFWGCPLKSISADQNGFGLPAGITTLPEGVFSCTQLSEICIPGTVKSIGAQAFTACSLKNIILEDGIETIGDRAFERCYVLSSVTILDTGSIKSIGNDVFTSCESVDTIYVYPQSKFYSYLMADNTLKDKCKLYTYMSQNNANYEISIAAATYTGSQVKPSVKITFKPEGKVLTEGVDYKLTYENNINVGNNAKITIQGINEYVGTMTKTFSILPINLKNTTITLAKTSYSYTGKAIKPTVKILNGKTTLKEGFDYKITYNNNTNAGTGKITITAMGNYAGTITKTFTIKKVSVKKTKISLKKYYEYKYKAVKPTPTIKLNGKTLVKGKDYTLKYSANNTYIANKAKITITGKGNYTGTITKTFKIKYNLKTNKKKVSVFLTSDGKNKKPQVEVSHITSFGSVTLNKKTDYKAKVSGGSNAIGTTRKVTITGKGSYLGSITCKVKIQPQMPKVKLSGTKLVITNYIDGADIIINYTLEKNGKTSKGKLSCTAQEYKKNNGIDITELLVKSSGKELCCYVSMKVNGVAGLEATWSNN